MTAEKNKLDYLSIDDSCCASISDNIINYIFDLSDYSKNIAPAVNKICNDMNTNEKEVLNKVLNKFYNNLNE